MIKGLFGIAEAQPEISFTGPNGELVARAEVRAGLGPRANDERGWAVAMSSRSIGRERPHWALG
jgi:hypothetical protein